MVISKHLSGVAIAFQPSGRSPGGRPAGANPYGQEKAKGREQGSLIGYQKRQVANAVEYIRQNAKHKAMIFVCTTSQNWGHEIFNPKISKFTNNLRMSYGCKHYVWVRELNSHGAPHYHFVADLPFIDDPVGLSYYWSGLFGYHQSNSVRLGSAPDKKTGKRKFYVNSRRMAFYLSKYLGKGFEDGDGKYFRNSWMSAKIAGRSFAMSQEVAKLSQPIRFEQCLHFTQPDDMVMDATGKMVQRPAIVAGRTFENELGEYFNPYHYTWKQAKEHQVYFGIEKFGQR